MSPLLVVVIVIAALFLAGQGYLHWRRRKASRFFEVLARHLGVGGRSTRIDLIVGSHRVVLDAQVTSDDRPEELRLTLRSNLPGQTRLTRPVVASHYDDCKHRAPAAGGEPFAGWYVRSEDPGQLAVLASDGRIRKSLETLAGLRFTRVELAKGKLRAFWPDFQWEPDRHNWRPGDLGALPRRARMAAESLSALATAAEAALHSTGHPLRGSRARAVFTALLLLPLLMMVAGIAALMFLYEMYPTVRDAQLLALMVLAGVVLSTVYTSIAYRLLRTSIERPARTALIGFVSLVGFCLGSSAPILWWNGTGAQGPGARVTVEVVRLRQDSAFASVRGKLLRKLIEEDSPIEEWSTTRRAIVRSWRDDSLYGIELSAEQFSALSRKGGRLSMTVSPGALGLEWYSEVAVLPSLELRERNPEDDPRGDREP